MNETDSENGIIPFGAETETTEAAAKEAATTMDAVNLFLTEGALPLLCALVVAVFLIYQFGRWFIAQGAMREPVAVTPNTRHAPVARDTEPADAEAEGERARPEMPWRIRQ